MATALVPYFSDRDEFERVSIFWRAISAGMTKPIAFPGVPGTGSVLKHSLLSGVPLPSRCPAVMSFHCRSGQCSLRGSFPVRIGVQPKSEMPSSTPSKDRSHGGLHTFRNGAIRSTT
ncbi:MAG: hypothetical protein MZV63_41315 [Marinilabiliales bacterium]|nr:hypothetical protein [Marinilabiliales bacterium]